MHVSVCMCTDGVFICSCWCVFVEELDEATCSSTFVFAQLCLLYVVGVFVHKKCVFVHVRARMVSRTKLVFNSLIQCQVD